MLAVLMYHDVVSGGGKYANDPTMLRAHLEYLRANHPVVLPGDQLPANRLSVCLTFDDGHASFFHTVYPMLASLQIKAVVSVCTDFIRQDTDLPPGQRLKTSSQQARETATWRENACFCTWKELREMQDSGLVQVACHSAGHMDLTAQGVDLDREILGAGRVIEDQLGVFPKTFVFPLGRVNALVKQKARSRYAHLMRIGEAMNRGWNNPGGMLYRLQGDNLRDEQGPLRRLWKPKLKYYGNILRLR